MEEDSSQIANSADKESSDDTQYLETDADSAHIAQPLCKADRIGLCETVYYYIVACYFHIVFVHFDCNIHN